MISGEMSPIRMPDVKLIDFGTSFMNISGKKSIIWQAPDSLFIAPEVLNNLKFSDKSDMWSLGVVIYSILVGEPPYSAKTNN
jgi:serine/threonine protein kinase